MALNESLECTCPSCGETRIFSSIEGSEGAGEWLAQHSAFHGYQRFIADMASMFGDADDSEVSA